MTKRTILALALWFICACDDDDAPPVGDIPGPSSAVLAGSEFDALFVASAARDALQVLDLSGGVNEADFVSSPSVFNPLLIPVGPSPGEMVASDDGRVVSVLDALGAAIRLVNADSRSLVLGDDGLPLVFELGAADSEPSSLEPDPFGCGGTCIGRFFASLSGVGRIVSLSVLDDDGVFRIGLFEVFEVGGRPTRMTATRDGRFLFAVDASSDEVVRIDRIAGTIERRAVDAPPGDIAVSGDGAFLLVARPALRDLLVWRDITDAWTIVDANSRLSPPVTCLAECSDDSTVCQGAHPATRAWCASDGYDGLLASAQPYRGLYLDVIPRRIETLSASAGQEALALQCQLTDTDTLEERTVNEYAVVIAEGSFGAPSTVRWVALEKSPEGVPDPQVADNGFCNHSLSVPASGGAEGAFTRPGRVSVLSDQNFEFEGREPKLGDFLQACPTIPSSARWQCLNPVEDDPDTDSPIIDTSVGVVVQPGRAEGDVVWSMEWEYPFLLRSNAGGTLLQGGTVLSDEELDLREIGVRVGDIVEVLTSPRIGAPECRQALDALGAGEESCNFERRVVGYAEPEPDRPNGGLVLGGEFVGDAQKPLPTECFDGAGTVSYRLRVGDAFAILRGDESQPGILLVGRAGIGGLFGPGGLTGQSQPVTFRVQDKYLRQGEDTAVAIDAKLTTSACERYEGDSEEPLAPQIRRDQLFSFLVRDETTVQIAGRVGLGEGSSVLTGSSPSSTVYGAAPGGAGRVGYLFTTYETSDALLIFRPSRPLQVDTNNSNDPDFGYFGPSF